MVFASLFPVVALIVAGILLKRQRLIDAAFQQNADRLVYYLFFPAMLFWKLGKVDAGALLDWSLVAAALLAITVQYLLSLLAIRLGGLPSSQAGAFSQSCYRFNTYIGMAVALTAFGEDGVRLLGMLAGFTIPWINLLAVGTLVWYAADVPSWRKRIRTTCTSIIGNPLILACIAGGLYGRFIGTFPLFIENTLSLFSLMALPLALISIGGSLSFAGLNGYVRPALIAALLKQMVYPVLGFCCLRLLGVPSFAMGVGMLFFSLPTSTAIYVLSAQLGSDTRLAAAIIVVSTILSLGSLSVVLSLF